MTEPSTPNDMRLRWTGPLVARFWDYYAQHKPQDYFTRTYGARIAAITSSHVPVGSTVCDYGCGAGFLTVHLAKRFRTTGVDFSLRNVEATRTRLAGVTNFDGAMLAEEARTTGKVFDAVYLVETVEHLLEEDVEATLRGVYESLRPGGIAVVTTPNEERLADAEVFCPGCGHTFHRWQHMRRFDAKGLVDFMSLGRFDCVRTFATDFGERSSLRLWLRRLFGKRPLPHLVYIGRRPTAHG
jgi:2-polyprenyl-3-methyl-5-hydroxy-6-metoxy-1,4-benzoquinol methylase